MEIDFEKLAEKDAIKIGYNESPGIIDIIDALAGTDLFESRADFMRTACREKIVAVIESLAKTNKDVLEVLLATQTDEKLDRLKRVIDILSKLVTGSRLDG